MTTKIPSSTLTIADQATAEAGVNNTQMMTPLRSAQAIAASSTASFPPGVILPYGGSSAPSGWLLCYGQSLLRASYAALFAIIGTTFGSVDGTHFTAPDMRGYIPVGKDNMGGSAANKAQATTNITCTSGSPTSSVVSASGLSVGMYIVATNVPAGTTITAISGTTLTMSQNASATTTVSGRFSLITDAQTLGAVGGAVTQTLITAQLASHTHTYNGGSFVGSSLASGADLGTPSGNTGSSGGGQPHPSMQPSMILNYIIKT